MSAKKSEQDDPKQSQRFINMAKEVEAEHKEEAFDRLFAAVANAPSTKRNHKPKKVLREPDL